MRERLTSRFNGPGLALLAPAAERGVGRTGHAMAMIDEGPCAGLGHRRIADRRMPMKIGLGMALALFLAAPGVTEPQTVKVHRIAFLGLSSPADYATSLQAFRQDSVILGTKREGISRLNTVGRRGVTSVFRGSLPNWFASTLTSS